MHSATLPGKLMCVKLFDAHNHLHDPRLAEHLDEVIARARAAGVSRMACCSTEEKDWQAVLDCAARFPDVIPSLEVHPCNVACNGASWYETLRELIQKHHSAIGEVGLDHAVGDRDDAVQ